jgi:3-deoxy-7-phosphoheptulonate synthase
MASGLSSPVGFKNGTDGGLMVAINALRSASSVHRFLGINSDGQVSVFTTRGNRYGHVVLRGGSSSPNYDSVNVNLCEKALAAAGMREIIMVDCSHANSNKDPSLQPLVADNVANQIVAGNRSVIGLMIESNIHEGNQSLSDGIEQLRYGVSITDGCISWEQTEECLRSLRDKLRDVLPARLGAAGS